jgi:hypothetical protein
MRFGRTFLYSKDCPLGCIFEDESEFTAALESSEWVEAPWLIEEAGGNKEEAQGKSPEQPLKPWQKAQLALKAKREGKSPKLG